MTVAVAPISNPGSLLSAVGSLVLGLAILALLLFRQMKVRGVRANPLLPTVLAVVGLIELDGYAQVHPFTSLQGTFLAVSLLVFAVGLGAVRAWTVRIWVREGRLVRQGTWATVFLWVIAVGLHLGLDAGNGVGEASLLLYLGLALGTQQLVVQWRARRVSS